MQRIKKKNHLELITESSKVSRKKIDMQTTLLVHKGWKANPWSHQLGIRVLWLVFMGYPSRSKVSRQGDAAEQATGKHSRSVDQKEL